LEMSQFPADPSAALSHPLKGDRRPCSGFSLLEAMIAIALTGTALIISTALLNTLLHSSDHLRAHQELQTLTETGLEMMRAGFLPLKSGILPLSTGTEDTPDLVVSAVVEKTEIPGLYLVTIRAECTFRHRKISRRLPAEIWRP